MVYKQYTMRGSKGVPYGWRCPDCGKLNLGVKGVSSAATYDDRGIFVRLDNRQAKARDALNASLDKRAMNAMLDAEEGRYDKLNLSAKCAQCGKVPPWANLNMKLPRAMTLVRNICLIGGAVVAGFGLTGKDPMASPSFRVALAALALGILLLLAGWLILRKRYSDVKPDIAALPKESLPHMAQTGPQLLQRLVQDGLLGGAEAEAMGAQPGSGGNSFFADFYREKAAERRKSRRTKLVLAAVAVAALAAFFGVRAVNSDNLKKWQAEMEAAGPFATDPDAGSLFGVYEKRYNGEAKFVKDYINSSRLAQTPQDLGYIVSIEDERVVVGQYSIGGNSFKRDAYKVYTTLRLFDRHTGAYVGTPVVLEGGDPPRSIKATSTNNTGSRPGHYEITSAITKLMAQVETD